MTYKMNYYDEDDPFAGAINFSNEEVKSAPDKLINFETIS